MKIKNTVTVMLAVFAIAISSTATAQAGIFDGIFRGFKKRRPNIAEYVIKQNERKGEFSTLLTALVAVSENPELPDLVGTLSNDGPFTVFAPTDEAFADLGLFPSNIATALPLPDLTDILLYHVAPEKKGAFRLFFDPETEMLNGDTTEFNFSIFPFGFYINDSKIIDPNNFASNGIVHVVDSVLLPPPDSAPAKFSAVAIPEPTTLALASGLICTVLLTTRRRY